MDLVKVLIMIFINNRHTDWMQWGNEREIEQVKAKTDDDPTAYFCGRETVTDEERENNCPYCTWDSVCNG